jgi:RimJ/RimL family protein N-acetyltransferase
MQVPTLETERLVMRAWRGTDHVAFAAFLANEDTARFIGGACDAADAWRRMCTQIGHWALRGYGSWVLEEKASGDWVGYSGLWNPHGWPEPEVMWGLKPEVRGRGYATEAAGRARVFAYDNLGWRTAISLIAPENRPSQKVAERLGAQREGKIELRSSVADVWRHPASAN